MNKEPIVIIDGNNYAYRSYYAYSRFSNKQGEPTSVLYGMPLAVQKIIKDLKPKKTFIVMDGNRHKKRLEVLPDYKRREKKVSLRFDPENFFKQKDEVADLFHNVLGIPVYKSKGQEADDLIYKLVRKYKKLGYPVIICSSDKDFAQLIDDQVNIYNFKKECLINPVNAYFEYGYKPEHCVDFLILTGDSSDNIKGYPGIGPKTAEKFLETYGSIKNFLKSGDNYKKIDKDKLAEVYKRNRILIDLVYFNRRFNLKHKLQYAFDNEPKKDIKSLKLFCSNYNINIFLAPTFTKYFKIK